MSRKDFVDLETGLYIPTMKEMGISDADIMQNTNEWYDQKVIAWQAKDKLKQDRKKLERAAQKALDAKGHWYNTLPKDEVIRLIEDSRENLHYFDELSQVRQLPKIEAYYQKLKMKVVFEKFNVAPCTPVKALQFPQLDSRTNRLFGSRTSFMRLWAFVFSSKRR